MLELIFDTCFDFGKNGEPFESIVNSSQIEGRAVGKSTKKRSKTDEKTVKKLRRKSDAFFVDFGSILEGFWEHFRSQNAIKNRVKILMRLWRSKRGGALVFWGRFGGMRGGAGRDRTGLSNSVEISTE